MFNTENKVENSFVLFLTFLYGYWALRYSFFMRYYCHPKMVNYVFHHLRHLSYHNLVKLVISCLKMINYPKIPPNHTLWYSVLQQAETSSSKKWNKCMEQPFKNASFIYSVWTVLINDRRVVRPRMVMNSNSIKRVFIPAGSCPRSLFLTEARLLLPKWPQTWK